MVRRFGGMLGPVVVFAMALVICGCERYPRDPRGSLERVLERGTLRVGVSEARPWVVREAGGGAGGLEAELLRRFADALGVEIEWRWGSAEHHFEAIELYELDVVVGGHTKKNPWTKRVGATMPFYTSETRVGVRPGAPAPVDLEGVEVGVHPASGLKDKIRDRGGRLVEMESFKGALMPVAGERWELEALGFTVTEIELGVGEHLMAVPPGENALLMALEKHLLHAMSRHEMQALLGEVGR